MRRDQQLRQPAAFYPTHFDCFPSDIENFVRQRRLFRPGLFLQLALLALLAVFFPSAKLHAQTGSITGTVVDPSGAAIPGAKVQVTDQATGNLTREASADAEGTFRALNLPPGTYRIKVSAPGMEELDRNGVVLDQDQTLGLGQVALTVGQASQTVTVTTQTPLIDTATSRNAAVVDQRQVTEQPLNGRDFESLLTTLPGVVTNNNTQFRLVFNQTDDFYVNGPVNLDDCRRGVCNRFGRASQPNHRVAYHLAARWLHHELSRIDRHRLRHFACFSAAVYRGCVEPRHHCHQRQRSHRDGRRAGWNVTRGCCD